VKFRLSEIATLLGAPGEGDAALSGVAVDSRRARPGDLFVAIRGARVDGHDYAAEAARRGAGALLGQRRPADLPPGFPILLVSDPVEALQRFAAKVRKDSGIRLAAITGSVGKTTTKEFTAAILARRFAVAKTPGNQNSQIGFPMSILNLSSAPEWMVGEMGLSAAGDLSRLSRAFEPDLAAILTVAPAHLEFFASLDDIAAAKAEILEGLAAGGVLVANADDLRVAAIAARHRGPVVRFGRAAGADVRAEDVVSREDESRFRLEMPNGHSSVRLPMPGAHQVVNFLAASAIAFSLGLSPADCAAAAAGMRPAEHRGELKRHTSGALLLDDSYNANPASMRAALETLAAIPARRRVAVLGDMLELGREEERWHRVTGRDVAGRADLLVCVGARARAIGEGAVEAGLPPEAVRSADSAEQACALLGELLREGDIALFKASRGVGLDRAVALLTAEG